jgi:hypothetical protein
LLSELAAHHDCDRAPVNKITTKRPLAACKSKYVLLRDAQVPLVGQILCISYRNQPIAPGAAEIYSPGVMRYQARLEPCVTCNNSGCGATIALKSLASEKIELDGEADFLRVTCPACGRLFSTSIFKLGWVEAEIHDSHEQEEGESVFSSRRERHLHETRWAA